MGACSCVSGTSQAEIAEIRKGQTTGLNINTTTAYSIWFRTNRFATGAIRSLEAQATGTKNNIVVNAPLVYKPFASLPVQTVGGVVSVSNIGYCSLTASSVAREERTAKRIKLHLQLLILMVQVL